MAGWVGKCTKLLERVADAIRDHVFEAQAIFMDDTTVKLLQKGKGRGKNKTKTARLWVYARDEKPWASGVPPAVWYQFSTSRGAEHPSQHLATYEGFAHADTYSGYNDAYRTGRVREMACPLNSNERIGMRHSYAAFSMAWQKNDPNAIALGAGCNVRRRLITVAKGAWREKYGNRTPLRTQDGSICERQILNQIKEKARKLGPKISQ